jgi:hypothetical protein
MFAGADLGGLAFCFLLVFSIWLGRRVHPLRFLGRVLRRG